MRKIIIGLVILLLPKLTIKAQNDTYKIDLTNPIHVVEAVTFSAKKEEYIMINCLCDPYKSRIGNFKSNICNAAKLAIDLEDKEILNIAPIIMDDYIRVTKQLSAIESTGNVEYKIVDGYRIAIVEVIISKKKREQINLIQRFGNWYIQ